MNRGRLYHGPCATALIAHAARQLTFNPGGPGMLSHMDDQDLIKQLLPNYKFLDLKTHTAEINQGKVHKGMSGLLGLVTIKPIE